jgi:transcription elongation factor Elf1
MQTTLAHPEDESDKDCPVCYSQLEIVEGTDDDGTLYCSKCKLHFEVRGGKFNSIRR